MAQPMPNHPLTDAERRLLELARRLAAANPDAAAVLGRHLTHYAGEQKRWQGCGILIRVNWVEGRVELLPGEK